jgi:hypothetical protein
MTAQTIDKDLLKTVLEEMLAERNPDCGAFWRSCS